MRPTDLKSNPDWDFLLKKIRESDQRSLARTISFVENELPGYEQMLEKLNHDPHAETIGITGPPGAGKSSLVDALIGQWTKEGKKIAVVCVDPSSPFHSGALLGDRLRMNRWYNHPGVFVRSLSSRGAIGGLNPKIIEITDLIKAAHYDSILIETVGVGQNEVDIAGMADTIVLVLVPGAGDDIQAMKSGILEIADICVVNKSDLPNADELVRYLQSGIVHHHKEEGHPVILKTIATQSVGIEALSDQILHHQKQFSGSIRMADLLAEKAWRLILQKKMKQIDKKILNQNIREQLQRGGFNLYAFVSDYG